MTDPTPIAKPSLSRAAITGAMVGLTFGIVGTVIPLNGVSTPYDTQVLATHALAGLVVGGVIGAANHLTRSFRAKGRLQHYSAWCVACILAAFLYLLPDGPTQGWGCVLMFSLWIGVSAGIAFGLVARKWAGHRW